MSPHDESGRAGPSHADRNDYATLLERVCAEVEATGPAGRASARRLRELIAMMRADGAPPRRRW